MTRTSILKGIGTLKSDMVIRLIFYHVTTVYMFPIRLTLQQNHPVWIVAVEFQLVQRVIVCNQSMALRPRYLWRSIGKANRAAAVGWWRSRLSGTNIRTATRQTPDGAPISVAGQSPVAPPPARFKGEVKLSEHFTERELLFVLPLFLHLHFI